MTEGELKVEDESNMKSITNKKDKNRDKSPIRGVSLERVPFQVQTTGVRLQKDFRDTSIVAQSQNAEPYYRRAIKRLGWKEMP